MIVKHVIAAIFCILGCSYQVSDISSRYFKYSTNTNIKILLADYFETPSVSLCFNLEDNMKSYLEKRFGVKKYDKYGGKTDDPLKFIVIPDIFINSVHESDILDNSDGHVACAIRQKKTFTMNRSKFNVTECMEYMDVRKYINKFAFCYRFEMKNKCNILESEAVQYSSSYPGVILIFYLNTELISKHSLYAISVHTEESSDYYDNGYSIENFNNFEWTPRIFAQFTTLKLSRKQYPYDTNRRSIPGYKTISDYQMELLTNLTIMHLKRVHTFNFVYDHYKLPIITPLMLANESFHDMFSELETMSRKGSNTNCDVTLHMTSSIQKAGHGARVSIQWPNENGMFVMSIPCYDFIDFMIYVLSSIGIWFGLSIFSIATSICWPAVGTMKAKLLPSVSKNAVEQPEVIKYFIIKDRDLVLRSKVQQIEQNLIVTNRNLETMRRVHQYQ